MMAKAQRSKQPQSRQKRRRLWLRAAVELSILTTCIVYLATNRLWALITWEVIAVLYLTIGLCVVWRGAPSAPVDKNEIQEVRRWVWVPPLISGTVGANSAVLALLARNSADHDSHSVAMMVTASAGIVLAWALLQVGFADVYQI
ncbi:MAG: DUF1345 domain-containing protein, partial [Rhodococcus sp.]|nr:DUF1345 domain-containing protein [Rhodococcus sp. (in: high G+C Gram-positive bacteria)]